MTDQNLKTKHLWYYMKSGLLNESQEGPFDEPSFLKLVRKCSINGDTKISSPTRTKGQWVFAKTIPVLMAKVNEAKLNREAEKEELVAEKNKHRAELTAQKAAAKTEAAQQKRIVAEQRAAEAEHRQQLAANQTVQPQPDPTPPAHPVAQPLQQTIVIHQRQSNTVPVLLNMFLWPGLGQLVQGRPLTGLLAMGLWIVSVLLIFVLIGFITTPILYFAALIDSAMYKG